MPITMESLTLVNALQTSIKMRLLTSDIVQLLSCWEQEVDGVYAFADVDKMMQLDLEIYSLSFPASAPANHLLFSQRD